MLIDRVLIGIVGLFWIINGIVFSVPPTSMVYGGYNCSYGVNLNQLIVFVISYVFMGDYELKL